MKKTDIDIESLKEKITREESAYENSLDIAAKKICENKKIKIILTAGGSCAGKTTTTKKLIADIKAGGRRCIGVSIDDFYKNPEDLTPEKDGSFDFESTEAIDTDYFHTCLENLMSGRKADLPRFDFIKKRRDEKYNSFALSEDDCVIIEGLHALNPVLYERYTDKENIFGIYLYTESAKVSQPRLLRRLVRDYYYRGSSAQNTFSMWESVKAGERENIEPFAHLADMKINTYFHYEKGCFVNDAKEILSHLKKDSEYISTAKAICDELRGVAPVDVSYVPADSLLREFIK